MLQLRAHVKPPAVSCQVLVSRQQIFRSKTNSMGRADFSVNAVALFTRESVVNLRRSTSFM
jgi:hypothetical protein